MVPVSQEHDTPFTSDWLAWGEQDSGNTSPGSEAGASSPQVQREPHAEAEPGEESRVPVAHKRYPPEIHAPQCLGIGLTVVYGNTPGISGWSCPQCGREYRVEQYDNL
jgi:hypothetical protein